MRIAMPWIVNSQDMLTNYAERYVLRTESNGCYLCVGDANQSIKAIESPENVSSCHAVMSHRQSG